MRNLFLFIIISGVKQFNMSAGQSNVLQLQLASNKTASNAPILLPITTTGQSSLPNAPILLQPQGTLASFTLGRNDLYAAPSNEEINVHYQQQHQYLHPVHLQLVSDQNGLITASANNNEAFFANAIEHNSINMPNSVIYLRKILKF